MHIESDRLLTHHVPSERQRHALRVARGGPNPETTVNQMSDDPMPKEAGRAKYGYDPPATRCAVLGIYRELGCTRPGRHIQVPQKVCCTRSSGAGGAA